MYCELEYIARALIGAIQLDWVKGMQVHIGPEKGNFGAFFVVPSGFAKTFVFDRKLPTK